VDVSKGLPQRAGGDNETRREQQAQCDFHARVASGLVSGQPGIEFGAEGIGLQLRVARL
jgi:hypothetical protein